MKFCCIRQLCHVVMPMASEFSKIKCNGSQLGFSKRLYTHTLPQSQFCLGHVYLHNWVKLEHSNGYGKERILTV